MWWVGGGVDLGSFSSSFLSFIASMLYIRFSCIVTTELSTTNCKEHFTSCANATFNIQQPQYLHSCQLLRGGLETGDHMDSEDLCLWQ